MTEKKFLKMKETCAELEVAAHVIRFWESELPGLSFQKNGSGHRIFSRQDLLTLNRIKDLLYTEGLSLEGVKKKMREGSLFERTKPGTTGAEGVANNELLDDLRQVDELIEEMIMMLDSP